MQKIYEQITKIIEAYIEDLKFDEKQYEDKLTDLGMNSITFIQVIVEFEEKFQIEIPDEYLLFSKMETVNKMAMVVEKLLTEANKKDVVV